MRHTALKGRDATDIGDGPMSNSDDDESGGSDGSAGTASGSLSSSYHSAADGADGGAAAARSDASSSSGSGGNEAESGGSALEKALSMDLLKDGIGGGGGCSDSSGSSGDDENSLRPGYGGGGGGSGSKADDAEKDLESPADVGGEVVHHAVALQARMGAVTLLGTRKLHYDAQGGRAHAGDEVLLPPGANNEPLSPPSSLSGGSDSDNEA